MKKIHFTAAILISTLIIASPLSAAKAKEYSTITPPSWTEIIITAAFTAAAGTIELTAHRENVTPTEPEGTLDYRINQSFSSTPNKSLKITGDIISAGGTAAAFGTYLYNMITSGSKHEKILNQRRFMTFWEGFTVTLFTTEVVKASVRRPRPNGENTASFFSGHSATGFYTASFMTGHISDYLKSTYLKNFSLLNRVLIGNILPGLTLYGLAGVAAFSRIRNHNHYFTDVLAGSAFGILVGNLSYYLFFPRYGQRHNTFQISGFFTGDMVGLNLTVKF